MHVKGARGLLAAVGLRKTEIVSPISTLPDQIDGWLDDNLWGSGPRGFAVALNITRRMASSRYF